jgi:hypothetical protein
VWVVLVITTGSQTIEGAVQAAMGFTVIQTLLSLYAPPRIVNITPLLFVVGAMTYAAHPEGVVEFQKRKWLVRVSGLLRAYDTRRGRTGPDASALVGPPNTASVVAAASQEGVNA